MEIGENVSYRITMVWIAVIAASASLAAVAGWVRWYVASQYLRELLSKRQQDRAEQKTQREKDFQRLEAYAERRLGEARASWEKEREVLTRQLMELASRPPIVLKDTSPAIIEAVAESITKIMGGGPGVVAKEETTVQGRQDNVEPAMWYPDIEFDSWLAGQDKFPTQPGWLPPPNRTEYMDAPDTSADNMNGLESAPRSPEDQRMFKSGEGGHTPEGGVE